MQFGAREEQGPKKPQIELYVKGHCTEDSEGWQKEF